LPAGLEEPMQPHAFPLHVQALSFPETTRPGLVPVLVEVPGGVIRYRPERGGKSYRADFTVLARIKDERGQEVVRLSQRYPLTATRANVEFAQNGSLLFYKEAELPEGRYSVEAVGYDGVAQQTSAASATVEVPAANQGRRRLSSIVLPKRVERLSDPASKCAGPLSFGDACLYPSLGEPFRKSESPTVGFFFVVYGAAGSGSSRKATIEVVQGDVTLASIDADLGAADAMGRIEHAGALPLAKFASGSYALKVTVGDGPDAETRVASFTVAE
jgi:hypothetical protein